MLPAEWTGEPKTPKGWWPIKAYTNGSNVIVEGSPSDPEHNCDSMGCGQCHVVAWFARSGGESLKEPSPPQPPVGGPL